MISEAIARRFRVLSGTSCSKHRSKPRRASSRGRAVTYERRGRAGTAGPGTGATGRFITHDGQRVQRDSNKRYPDISNSASLPLCSDSRSPPRRVGDG